MNTFLKRIIIVLAALLLIAMVVLKLVNNKKVIVEREENAIRQQQFDVVPVKSYTVSSADFSEQYKQSGTFTQNQELRITALAQGQIKNLAVKKSQQVTKGTLLATIDHTALSSQIETVKASLEKAKLDVNRIKSSLETGGVTKQQLENAELQVKSMQANLSQLQQQSENYRIVAPISGVINDVYVEQGSYIAPGTPICQLVDITKIILSVSVNQELIPMLKIGQRAKITTDVYTDKVFEGKIETINVQADASQKFKVGISFANLKDYPILPGMFGKAEFVFDDKNSNSTALSIPRSAIITSILKPEVYVINADSTVSLRSLKVGKSQNGLVEVLEGLKQGEEIVTAGQINLESGKKVTIKN